MAQINPWDRQPGPEDDPTKGESAKAFEAFSLYLDLGPSRSVEEVARKCTKSSSGLRRWSAKWNWIARAAAWDDHLRQKMLKARVRKQADRLSKEEDDRYERGQKMWKRLDQMLDFPLATREVTERYPDGREKTVIISPLKWDFKGLVSGARVATELIDSAIGIRPESEAELEDKAATATDAPRRIAYIEVEEVHRDPEPEPEVKPDG